MGQLWATFLMASQQFCGDAKLPVEACESTSEALGTSWNIPVYSQRLETYGKDQQLTKEKLVLYPAATAYFIHKKKGSLTFFNQDGIVGRVNGEQSSGSITFTFSIK